MGMLLFFLNLQNLGKNRRETAVETVDGLICNNIVRPLTAAHRLKARGRNQEQHAEKKHPRVGVNFSRIVS